MGYNRLPSFVLGFHGCDEKLKLDLINGKKRLAHSNNCYDWLGSGIYFWENDPNRALSYAKQIKKHPERCKQKIETPAVVGAIIDLGYCLNLFEEENLKLVKESYTFLKAFEKLGWPMPVNKGGKELLLRDLDCAVINLLHDLRKQFKEPPFDTVRAPFLEGEPLYPNAGFKSKNHIQICVRSNECIKGYFDPIIY